MPPFVCAGNKPMDLFLQTHAQRRSMEAEASQRAVERNHERALTAVREEAKKKVLVVHAVKQATNVL